MTLPRSGFIGLYEGQGLETCPNRHPTIRNSGTRGCDEFATPPVPQQAGTKPNGRPDDPACAGPTASRHSTARGGDVFCPDTRSARRALSGSDRPT